MAKKTNIALVPPSEPEQTATLINNVTGEKIPVTSTTNHPSSSYGQAVWVDADNNAYLQVGLEHLQAFYSVTDIVD